MLSLITAIKYDLCQRTLAFLRALFKVIHDFIYPTAELIFS